MPDNIIKKVNKIGLSKRKGCKFRFLNRLGAPYEWTDLVPEDDPEFQGLLEDEARFPDVSAMFPGVPLECNEETFEAMTDDPEPDFDKLAAVALENAGIDTGDRLRPARVAFAALPPDGPRLIEAGLDKIVYNIMFDLPDGGLAARAIPPDDHFIDDVGAPAAAATALPGPAAPREAADDSRRYPT